MLSDGVLTSFIGDADSESGCSIWSVQNVRQHIERADFSRAGFAASFGAARAGINHVRRRRITAPAPLNALSRVLLMEHNLSTTHVTLGS